MSKQMTFAIHYTHNENENKIMSVFITSENIKFALKKFEKKFRPDGRYWRSRGHYVAINL